jgi:hypothetical protein
MPLNICRTPYWLAALEWFVDDSSREFDRRTQARRFCRAKSRHRFQRGARGRDEPGESTKSVERFATDRPGITLAISCSQHQRDQFGIRQRSHALLFQSLTRTICRSDTPPRIRPQSRR